MFRRWLFLFLAEYSSTAFLRKGRGRLFGFSPPETFMDRTAEDRALCPLDVPKIFRAHGRERAAVCQSGMSVDDIMMEQLAV